MLRCPSISPHLKAHVVNQTGVFMLSEFRQVVLHGDLYELVVPALDGRPVEEICSELSDRASASQVIYTIRNLDKRGFLCEQDETLPAGNAAQWTVQNIESIKAARRLADTTVSVHGLGVDPAPLISLLAESGLNIVDDGKLAVVLTDNYLNKDLAKFNQQAIQRKQPWLLAKPVGGVVWIGPIFQPDDSGCWECLARRIRSNYPVMGYLDKIMNGDGTPATDTIQSPTTLSAAWGLIGNALTNWIANEEQTIPQLKQRMQTINLITLSSQSHVLVPHPTCHACGQQPEFGVDNIEPLTLNSCPKSYTEDGGHRATSPEQTIQKYEHHVSYVCGAVSMLERASNTGDGVMHVFVSGNNVARGPQSLLNLRVDLRSQSSGKGVSEMQAKASALCEGLERYSGVYSGDEPKLAATYRELGDRAIHPNDCMRFSERQLAERDKRNATRSTFGYIPQLFDPAVKIDWTPAWSLTRQEPRFLPTQFCYFSYPMDGTRDFSVGCSNGNAAGNSLEEAIFQGFLELVERDGVGIWWYNRVQAPAVDLDSFDEPYLNRLRARLKQGHRDLWVLDLTNDVGIPVFAAVSRRTDGGQEQIMFGFGAHLDPRIALLRSVTELNQMLVSIFDSAPEGPPPNLTDPETIHWLETATINDHPYLLPSQSTPTTAATYTPAWTDDIRDDVAHCQSVVENLGMEMLVLDQTRPEVGLPVVKVIVPGLRHFWSRLAPGRLYDVPVKLGWLEQPHTEDEMNPIAMFL